MNKEAMLDALRSAEIGLYEGGRELREGELIKQVAIARRSDSPELMVEALKAVKRDLDTECALYKKVVAALGC